MLAPFDFEKRREEYIEEVIFFVYKNMCKWRNQKKWSYKENERTLNSDLVKYLMKYARNDEIEANFFSEAPQGDVHTIDLIAYHYDKNIENYNNAIMVFECKRLTKDFSGNRKYEYVTGHKDIKGGIQRFKLEVHGKDYDIVGMIGYIQTGTCFEWYKNINNYIDTICDIPDEDGLHWNRNEHLNIIEYDEKKGKTLSKSLHPRLTKSDITIHHLWIDMQENESL
jgi:hypothetical protein